jgi:hypothetical protein
MKLVLSGREFAVAAMDGLMLSGRIADGKYAIKILTFKKGEPVPTIERLMKAGIANDMVVLITDDAVELAKAEAESL